MKKAIPKPVQKSVTRKAQPVPVVRPVERSKRAEPEVETFRYAELPDIRVSEALPVEKMGKVQELLQEMDFCALEEKLAKERGDKIKLELEELQMEAKLSGFRFETLCFVSRLMPGRRTLDKHLLIENGVDPEVIDESMKTGEPYMERRFKNIAK